MTKLKILVGVGFSGAAIAALVVAGTGAAGERAARLAAQEICAWERGAGPEADLEHQLGMGQDGRSFLVGLRHEKAAIECVPTSSSYSEAIGERAVTVRVRGRNVVDFRIAPTLGGPKVLGYWTEAP